MLVQEGCVKLGARALASTRDRVARGRPRARAREMVARARALSRPATGSKYLATIAETYAFFVMARVLRSNL